MFANTTKWSIPIDKYMWGMGFIALALLSNPLLSAPFTYRLLLGLAWFSIGVFLVSLPALRIRRLLSVTSITART